MKSKDLYLRTALFLILITLTSTGYGQPDSRISTIDFVEILNDNKEEAIFYFKNNWEVLRTLAIGKGYIESFQFLEAPANEEFPFHLIFITTYPNSQQYENREQNFAELIKVKGGIKLKNHKQPDEFRKTLFSKEMVRHWN